MVLANDIPDTANLRATLQCLPGSGAVTVAGLWRERRIRLRPPQRRGRHRRQ